MTAQLTVASDCVQRSRRTPRFWLRRHIQSLFGLVLAAVAVTGFAEGSRTLYPAAYPAGGFRADLDLTDATNLYAGVTARRQFLYVYANAGEYILAGSSNRANGGDIFVYNPQSFGTKGNETIPATADFTCSAAVAPAGSFSGGSLGQIAARANELAGPNSADNSATVTNGYAPCAYLAPSTGIYGVLFSDATAGGSAPSGSVANLHVGSATVAAWEVAVRVGVASLTDINARVFTYGFVAFTGGNGRPVFHTLYYATLDGSRYQQTMQGLDPNGYALWGNVSGYLDSGQPLYKDVRGTNNLVSTGFPAEINAQLPQTPVFVSTIDPAGANAAQAATVLQALGIPLSPPTPQLSNPAFNGLQSGNNTYVGGGGTFTFTTQNDTSYQIVISADGVDFDPGNPVNATLTGLAPDGPNSVLWNGSANNGAAFPTGTFTFQIVGRNGEIHFPIIDSEGNANGGPTLTKLNGVVGDHTVYFDDRGYVTRDNVAVGTLNGLLCPANPPVPSTPDHSLIGVDSSVSSGGLFYRSWPGNGNSNSDCSGTAGFGDAKALDLWSFQSTAAQVSTVIINPVPATATVATSVSVPPTAFPGSTVNGSFNFQNVGNTAATGVTYTAVVGTPGNCPTNLAFPLLPAGVTFTYDPATCIVTLIGMPTTLTPGQDLDFNFSYTAPASGTVPVTTTIDSANGGSDTANGVTAIIVSDVTTTITVPATAASGSTVSGTIDFGNSASATTTANGVTYAATIGTPGSCPANVTFPVLPAGVTATYNSSTCQVTFAGAGLPASLAPGQTLDIGFQYTAPASGTVPVSSAITTTTPESNTANNTSSGSTTFLPPNITLAKAGPATAVQGVAFDYTLNLGNSGAVTSGVTLTVADVLPAGVTANSVTAGADVTSVNCGSLPSAAGATLSCTVNLTAGLAAAAANGTASFTINATAANLGSITNFASVDPSGGNTPPTPGVGCTPATSCGNATTTVNTPPDITLAKAGPVTVSVNGALVYTISLGNSGGSASGTTLTVADVLPAGVTYQSATAGTNVTSVTCTGTTTLSCTVNLTAALAAGAANGAATFTINTTAPATSGSITNFASVDPSGGNNPPTPGAGCTPATSCGSAPTTINTSPNITLAKAGPATVQASGALTYTISLGNNGGSASATTLTVEDVLPAGVTYQSAAAGTNVTSLNCAGTTTLTCTVNLTAALAAGAANGAATFTVNTTAPATSGSITNYASVDPSGGNNPPAPGAGCAPAPSCGSATTTITAAPTPVLQIVKTGPATATAGGNIAYTITVTNVGAATATNAILTDPAPNGLTFVSAGTPCGAGFPCNLGTLNASQSITVSAVTFAVASTVTGTILNTASVTSDQTTQTSSSASAVVTPAGGGTVAPTPIDARWMLLAMMAMLAGAGARKMRVRR